MQKRRRSHLSSLLYSYDSVGNIVDIQEKNSNNTTVARYSYVYDSLNQLTRENIYTATKKVTYQYIYGSNGNIIYKKEYNYTTGTLPSTANSTLRYYYQNDWKDQLSAVTYTVFGQSVTTSFVYDQAGNVTDDGTYLYEWEGRQLVKLTNQDTGVIIEYRYNDEGIRTYKKISMDYNTYDEYFYYLDGDRVINEHIVHQDNGTKEEDNIYYTYDVDGTLISMNYNGIEYFYMRNLQNDVIALLDKNGTIIVEYQYDAWGNIIYQTNNDIANVNPYKYRGYRYDEETGWYYLNSRYYNPEIGRFINADGLIGPVGGILTHNMYAYTSNNPVMFVDPSGEFAITTFLICVGVGLAGGAVLGGASAMQNGAELWSSEFWQGVGTGAVIGGVIGAGVGLAFAGASGGVVANFGTAFVKGGMKSVGGKFVADIFSATLFGTGMGSIESYGVAFVTGGLSKGFFGGKGLAGFGMDVAVRPLLTQFAEIGTGKSNGFSTEKLAYDVVVRSITYGAGDWKPFYRGFAKGMYPYVMGSKSFNDNRVYIY